MTGDKVANPAMEEIRFNADGLVPAIVRRAVDGEVLTLCHLNAEAVERTLATGRLHRWSRSRKALVVPEAGEAVREVRLSCSGDALLVAVEGLATGGNCFSRLLQGDGALSPATPTEDILEAVYRVILERRANSSRQSYVASLFDKGLDKILGKIGEEATETAVAGKGGDPEAVVYEAADLVFHVLVLLGYYELPPERIYAELRRRFGLSGIAEKAGRAG